jgi:hypothetical protein
MLLFLMFYWNIHAITIFYNLLITLFSIFLLTLTLLLFLYLKLFFFTFRLLDHLDTIIIY